MLYGTEYLQKREKVTRKSCEPSRFRDESLFFTPLGKRYLSLLSLRTQDDLYILPAMILEALLSKQYDDSTSNDGTNTGGEGANLDIHVQGHHTC